MGIPDSDLTDDLGPVTQKRVTTRMGLSTDSRFCTLATLVVHVRFIILLFHCFCIVPKTLQLTFRRGARAADIARGGFRRQGLGVKGRRKA